MAGDYSSDDILKMQQDAAKRVREMQARSRFTVDHMPPLVTKEPPAKAAKPDIPVPKTKENQKETAENTNQRAENRGNHLNHSPIPGVSQLLGGFPLSGNKLGLLEMLHTDSDGILLMAILFVLYTEKADELLMLAIIYIMM